jgi:hypothetical protein
MLVIWLDIIISLLDRAIPPIISLTMNRDNTEYE